ncbi:MAG TPA: hypothetical protein VF033_09000 [Steroidobacteraceae bacterium]
MKKVTWVSGIVALAMVAGAIWLLAARGRSADAQLRAQPVYQVVRRHEPEVYAQVLERYQASLDGRLSTAEFTSFANDAISQAATGRLGRAPADAQLALVRDMTANLKLLRARPDDACFRYLYPEIAGGADVAATLPADAQAHTLALAAEVIRTSAETPAAPPSRERAAQALAPVVDAVYAQFGADTQIMAHAREPGVDRAKVCDIAIALYDRMLALPPAEASLVLSAVADPG